MHIVQVEVGYVLWKDLTSIILPGNPFDVSESSATPHSFVGHPFFLHQEMTDYQALISQSLEKSQVSEAVHSSLVRELHKAHKKNPPKFRRAFVEEANQVLLVLKREAAVERLIKFLVSFTTGKSLNDERSTVLVQEFTDFMLKYLLALVVAKEKTVRFRCCQLISGIMEVLSSQENVELG